MKTRGEEDRARRTCVSCCREDAISAIAPAHSGTAARPGMAEVSSRSQKLGAPANAPARPAISASLRGNFWAKDAGANPRRQPKRGSHARDGSRKNAQSGFNSAMLTAIASETAARHHTRGQHVRTRQCSHHEQQQEWPSEVELVFYRQRPGVQQGHFKCLRREVARNPVKEDVGPHSDRRHQTAPEVLERDGGSKTEVAGDDGRHALKQTAAAGRRRRARRRRNWKKENFCSAISLLMIRVMRNPEMTKNKSTPANPPGRACGRAWYPTTARMAIALRPSDKWQVVHAGRSSPSFAKPPNRWAHHWHHSWLSLHQIRLRVEAKAPERRGESC